MVAGRATALVDLGQWTTLEGWLAPLPDEALASYPDLIYCRADIAAARGQEESARRWFDAAASQCTKRDDVAGACRSMLGASALAADRGDLAAALSRAYAVGSLAETDDLAAARMWASWQQGRLQLVTGDTDSALASFCRAASVASACPKSAAAQPVRFTGQLAQQVSELRRQQEAHREAQDALKRAEHDTLNQLLAGVRVPAWTSDEVLAAYGWSQAPAPLKLPGLGAPGGQAPAGPARPLARLRHAVLPGRKSSSTRRAHADSGRAGIAAAAGAAGAPVTTPPRGARLPETAVGRRGEAAELTVHLLGTLCVAVDDVPVEEWPSARCRSLFGYLLTHREPWPARDVLMEVFWPESSPAASRNSLNVAIHSLRRTLRTATVMPVILHSGGAYRIHLELRLWLDVDEFDARAECGRHMEETGEPDKAMLEYECADGLYRGDFLGDDPYEEWAALTRERLRLALIQYRSCVRALADELGADTDPATARLHDRIRRHEPV